MPVYNTERYVGQAIQSILDQSFKNFELIIIEDGSTDNSLNIINSFNDSRIKIHINNKNKGLVYTRNKGLSLSEGEYIGMLDSDDIAYPDRFKIQIDFLEENMDFGMVGAWARFIDENGKRLPKKWKLNASPGRIPSIMLFRNYFVQSTVVCRSEYIKNLSYKDGFIIMQDYMIWVEMVSKYKSWNLQTYLIDYRIHKEGVTNTYINRRSEKEKIIFKYQLSKLGIEATDKEIELHILIRYDKLIKDIKLLNDTEKWLLKIVQINEAKRTYNTKILIREVFNRWMKACYKARKLHFKMLNKFLKSELTRKFLLSYFTRN